MRKFRVSGVAVAVAVLVGGVVAPVQAASAEEATPLLPHCVVEIFPLGAPVGTGAEAVCFATEAEVAEFLGRMAQPNPGGRAVAASVAVGTVYKDANAAGGSLTFWGTNGCAGATFGFASVAADWNTSISSVRASNGCWGTAYSATGYGGSRVNCTPYCASLGALNDAVKSLVFRPSGTLG
jgi:hypothetical protein